jgi:hypothetical protein
MQIWRAVSCWRAVLACCCGVLLRVVCVQIDSWLRSMPGTSYSYLHATIRNCTQDPQSICMLLLYSLEESSMRAVRCMLLATRKHTASSKHLGDSLGSIRFPRLLLRAACSCMLLAVSLARSAADLRAMPPRPTLGPLSRRGVFAIDIAAHKIQKMSGSYSLSGTLNSSHVESGANVPARDHR